MLKADRFTSIQKLPPLKMLDASTIDQSLANLLPEWCMAVKKGLRK